MHESFQPEPPAAGSPHPEPTARATYPVPARPAPPDEPKTAPPAPPDEPQAAPAAGKKDRWELLIAIVISIITITSALTTYMAVRSESTAAGYDQQSVVETLKVATHQNSAQTKVSAVGGIAGQYRTLLAQADALATSDPVQARYLRIAAAEVYDQAGLQEGMSGLGATATFDAQAQLQVELQRSQAGSPPDDQPEHTAQLADTYHRRAEVVSSCAVLLLAMLVLVTIARVSVRRGWRRPLLVIVAAGYVAAVVTTAVTTV